MQRFVFVVVLACAGQWAVAQDFDCNTDAGQVGFLENGARTDPNCYNPVLGLIRGESSPSLAEIAVVCQENCAGIMVDFLRSTEECRNNMAVRERADYLQSRLCAYKDGRTAATSCVLETDNSKTEDVGFSCSAWFVSEITTCPDPIQFPGVPTRAPCADSLKAAIQQYGCCYEKLFGSEEFISEITREGREFAESVDFTLPDDFQVDPTDPELFRACSVSLPAQCRSQLTTDSAPGVVATPLVALLFAVVAKLFA